jgi:uncharacterized SAM-binding protein YcdF (DUF218 family)
MPRLSTIFLTFFFIVAFGSALILRPLMYYFELPKSNTQLKHFDTLLVLGYPCNTDGSSSPEQRERVLESVREFKNGVASHIIMSGGAAHNACVEAHAMKTLAVANGVPADDVIEESTAKDTLQNVYDSYKIMQSQGWNSAEVISSPSHLRRAALILQHYPILWRTHASEWPGEYSFARILAIYISEIKQTRRIHTHGFPPSAPFPQAAATASN